MRLHGHSIGKNKHCIDHRNWFIQNKIISIQNEMKKKTHTKPFTADERFTNKNKRENKSENKQTQIK